MDGMDIKVLKPTDPEITVRDPKTREQLPKEGKAVRMTTFWRRRISDGSVIEVMATPPTEVVSPAPAVEDGNWRKSKSGDKE